MRTRCTDLDLDLDVQELLVITLRQAVATGARPNEVLVVVAEGDAGEVLSATLPELVISTTDSGTVVAVLDGERRDAFAQLVDGLGDALKMLKPNQLAVILIRHGTLRLVAYRVCQASPGRVLLH